MIHTEIAVVGAGPAGLRAAIQAANAGARVLLIERSDCLGGQLIKQTHKFFGSKEVFAGERGFDIARILIEKAERMPGITIWSKATVLGHYPDGVLTVKHKDRFCTVKPRKVIIATGAAEKSLAFPNNDLPGIYGAGAIQTLMNVYGVRPASRILMVGAGNIGVIVAYQLLQAGVEVAAIVEAAPEAGAYHVHAAKVKRCGVPLLTSSTIKEAHGGDCLHGVTLHKINQQFQPVPGTEQFFAVDGLCLAVGLTPLTELLWQAGCRMEYIPELGGYVPWRNKNLMTTVRDIYVAGDVAGIEEASTAMAEGKVAGFHAAFSLGYHIEGFVDAYKQANDQLTALRAGPTSEKIRFGIDKITLEEVG
jgi:sarcosine oxidase subunit alpha